MNQTFCIIIHDVTKSQALQKYLYKKEGMQNQSNLVSAEGRLGVGSLCRSDDVDWSSWWAVQITNGLTDDRRDSGASADILLHTASQLLITSVNLPLSSPISTCNA